MSRTLPEFPIPRGPRYRDLVIAGLLLGLVLLGAGGYVALYYGIPDSIPLFVAGFGSILFLAGANRRYQQNSINLRRSIDFATTALNAALLAGSSRSMWC